MPPHSQQHFQVTPIETGSLRWGASGLNFLQRQVGRQGGVGMGPSCNHLPIHAWFALDQPCWVGCVIWAGTDKFYLLSRANCISQPVDLLLLSTAISAYSAAQYIEFVWTMLGLCCKMEVARTSGLQSAISY